VHRSGWPAALAVSGMFFQLAGSALAQQVAVPPPIERHQWILFDTDNSSLPHDEVRALAVGEGGALWVGTGDGLARFVGGG
jgi:ligand-binding sensor domain-containing protein